MNRNHTLSSDAAVAAINKAAFIWGPISLVIKFLEKNKVTFLL